VARIELKSNGRSSLLAAVKVIGKIVGDRADRFSDVPEVRRVVRKAKQTRIAELHGGFRGREQPPTSGETLAEDSPSGLQLLDAGVPAYRAAVALDNRNFGVANDAVATVVSCLKVVDASAAGIDDGPLAALKTEAAGVRISVAADLVANCFFATESSEAQGAEQLQLARPAREPALASSMAVQYDVCYDSARNSGQNIPSIHFPPGVAARRPAQMVDAIVDHVSASPVALTNMAAAPPIASCLPAVRAPVIVVMGIRVMVTPMTIVLIVMIVGPRGGDPCRRGH
jgi:hypothetical protein